MFIPVLDELFDAPAQIGDRREGAAANGTLRDQPEPSLDLVEPGTVGGNVVQLHAPMLGEPSSYSRMLVSTVVIEHQMQIEALWSIGLDVAQKREEFLMAMTRFALSEDLAVGDI